MRTERQPSFHRDGEIARLENELNQVREYEPTDLAERYAAFENQAARLETCAGRW